MCTPPWPVCRKQKIEWHKRVEAKAVKGKSEADDAANEAESEGEADKASAKEQ